VSTLDQQLAEAVKSGLQGITLFSTRDGRWQASTTTDRLGWSVTIDPDPIAAVRIALSAMSTKTTNSDVQEDIFG
jgi:hypothetical protein